MLLSKHFTLSEFTTSQTAVRKGIDNTPSQQVISNLKNLCESILEPLRDMCGKPIRISSGYRSPDLNTAIGGSKTSQHCFGQAADFTVIGWSVEQAYQFIKHSELEYRQLIQEFDSWVHISISAGDTDIKKRENLRAVNKNGKTVYLKD